MFWHGSSIRSRWERCALWVEKSIDALRYRGFEFEIERGLLYRGLARIIALKIFERNYYTLKSQMITDSVQIDLRILWKITLIRVSNKKRERKKHHSIAYQITLDNIRRWDHMDLAQSVQKMLNEVVQFGYNFKVHASSFHASIEIIEKPSERLRLNESHVSIFFLIYDNLATRISEAAKRERRWEMKNGRNEICRVVEWKFCL